MNRTPVYPRTRFDYLAVRRQAEALRREEVSRLVHGFAARLRELRIDTVAVVRRTLDRIRGASAWTFFGAS